MIYLGAISCGLSAGTALGFGIGLGAATIYAKIGGSNSGGSEMGVLAECRYAFAGG